MSTSERGRIEAPARLARVAGACYLAVIAGGVFAALFVREPLFVAGDPAATASAVAANEALWRWGIAVHLLYLLPGAAAAVILYRLFRPVGPTLALLALAFSISDVAIEPLLLTTLTVPLALTDDGGTLGALDEGQRQALSYLAVRFFFRGWSFALLLFSGFCASIGILILRSRLLPRAIGALMLGAAAGYFLSTLIGLLAPGYSFLTSWLLVACFVGELSLALWLAAKGVRASGTGAA